MPYDESMPSQDIAHAFGKALRAQRKRAGFTLSLLAERAGVDPGFLAYIEAGKKTPSLQTVDKLAAALGVCVSDLFKDYSEVHESVKSQIGRHLRMLCNRSTPAQMADILAVLKQLGDPAFARAVRTLTRR